MATLPPDSELRELNEALDALAVAFPNIRPEVFREMLTMLSKESRAEVVAEHLLRNGQKWVRDRWRFPAQETTSQILREVYEDNAGTTPFEQDGQVPSRDELGFDQQLVPLEERFRSASYKTAVYNALKQEFKSLSRSTIQGVLAEQNFSYTLSHPILRGLAAKTWRVGFISLFTRLTKTNSSSAAVDEEHHMLQWGPGTGMDRSLKTPYLRSTGDEELDKELERTVLDPVLNRRKAKEDAISMELALLLNEQEAELASATYECQVCFADVPFEHIALCTAPGDGHVTCFGCIQRSVSEALYGQSWDRTVDHVRGQVACFAPTDHACPGCIPRVLAMRAVEAAKGGHQVWEQFEQRVLDDSLRKSGLDLVQCPFCEYSELDALYLPSQPVWEFNVAAPIRTVSVFLLGIVIITLLGLLVLIPLLLFFLLGLPFTGFDPYERLHNYATAVWRTALALRLRQTQLSRRFTCKSPTCRKTSCLECRKLWRDIHHCHESATLSLRTTVEAARTAALKRTCPRCGVGFVKESGCNKMVCICGYAMCYICREGLGDRKAGGVFAGEAEANNEQGYRHFCQHFRPMGGRCTECERCDLYRAENEDEIVRRAGERAERDWRERNEVGGVVKVELKGERSIMNVVRDSWRHLTVQGVVNWWVCNVFTCRLESKSTEVSVVTEDE